MVCLYEQGGLHRGDQGTGSSRPRTTFWYIDGKQAIKFDRHVAKFMAQGVGRTVTDDESIDALRQIAAEIGISATALDARIWDYMQSRCD